MFKKFVVIIAMLVLFASVSAFAQSFDVVVHNVTVGAENVILKVKYNQEPYQQFESKPAAASTITFNNIPTSQGNVATAIKAVQGSRSDEKVGGLAPFSTYHLYLPGGGVPWDYTIPMED